MQTMSLFPAFLDYQILGIFALRITIGFIFIYFWYEKSIYQPSAQIHFLEKLKLRPAKIYFLIMSYAEGIAGSFLVLGLYTQGVAIFTGSLMLIATIVKLYRPAVFPKNTVAFYLILAVISFSFLLLGPGAFAIDLPL